MIIIVMGIQNLRERSLSGNTRSHSAPHAADT